MGKKRNSTAATRAWRLLRLALLWARKGGLLKCKLVAELRLAQKYIKALKPHHHHRRHSRDMIRYGERELSFDETPVIHLRMSRPASLRFIMPCIKPEVQDFDYDFEGRDDGVYGYGLGGYNEGRLSLVDSSIADQEIEQYDDREERGDDEYWMGDAGEDEEEEGKGIDLKAEEFIASFYKQMKLQRQISYLQYNERMVNRGAN